MHISILICALLPAGWTPLHYAAILSPPTLVSYLMTHGCSPFAVTERKLTPLDIVTAHSMLPGKEDVALLLEEAMRGEGWTGGRMEERRKVLEQRSRKQGQKKEIRESVGKILGVNPDWWGKDSELSDEESDSDEEEEADDGVYVSINHHVSLSGNSNRFRHHVQIMRRCSFSLRLFWHKYSIH